MIPPGVDPRKMDQMMRQMGIRQEPVEASRVVIETSEGSLVIESPQVVKVTMQGQSSFQISGEARFVPSISPDDVKMVAEQAGATEEEALAALQAAGGDIAKAILSLQDKQGNK